MFTVLIFTIFMTPAIALVLSLLVENRFDRAGERLEAFAFIGFMINLYILIA